MLRVLPAVFLCSLACVPAALAQAPHPPMGAAGAKAPVTDGTAFQKDLRARTAFLLEDAAVALDGVLGYAIGDLSDGDGFERLSTVPFPAASTIKLAVLYELVKRADERSLSLDDTIVLSRARAVPGGLLYELGTPTLSLRDYANAMIIESDNTATNVLIERLGMDAINARMRKLGLESLALRRYMIDIEAARKGLENVASPADLGRLLQVFHKAEGLSPDAQREALTILKKHKLTPIRRAVPADVAIASKTGGLEGVRAEAAIVYAKNRPFVVVVMTTFLEDEDAGDTAIERLARVAYGYYARLGAAAPQTGRQIYR
jgi:beta-lactamase class A